MAMLKLADYAAVLLYFGIGAAFLSVTLFMNSLFKERSSDPKRLTTYECGMETIGTPYVSPNIRFYVFALIFVIFDMEAVFILPWAVKFRELGWAGFAEMMTFIGILFVAFAVAWRKGALRWE